MDITIPINRRRIPHTLIISCLLIAYLIYDGYKKSGESVEEGEDAFSWIAYAAIIFVLLYYAIITFIEYIKTLFDKNASLTITDVSIVDNLSIFSCGRILWDDIIDVEIKRMTFAEILIIKVQSPLKYLQHKNIIQRRVLKQLIKKMGSPVIIPDQRINHDLHKLKEILLEYKNNNQNTRIVTT